MEQLALSAPGMSSPAIPGVRTDGPQPCPGCSAVETLGDKRKIPKKTKPNQILLIEKMCWQLARGLTFRLMQILGGEAVPIQQRQRDLSLLVGIRRWAWWFKGENKTDTGTEGRGIQAHLDQTSCQQ